MRGYTLEPDDPLTRALAPPPNETQVERDLRLRKEAEARKVSDEIDESLKAERTAWKKRKIMRMLLLGQSESGKTTTLKNMQLTYAPKAWAFEKAAWKAVIQLNLIRSINMILDELSIHLASMPQPSHSSFRRVGRPSPSSPPSPTSDDDNFADPSPTLRIPSNKRSHLLKLNLRLAPLRQVEMDLKMRLGDGTEEITDMDYDSHTRLAASPFDDPLLLQPQRLSPRPSREVVVRSHQMWMEKEKKRKERHRGSYRATSAGAAEACRDSTTEVLASCAEDMVALWTDSVVGEMIEATGLIQRMGDSAEHFLGRINSITDRDYVPSDVDVLRARIRTLGVQEYNLVFEIRGERDFWKEWAVYDVGGARTQRRAWVPYFSDVQAILFLAPISVFDERLAEDHRVNRVQDSFELWEAIVKSDLLKDAILILFMNKCDLLERKLQRGIQVKKYLPSYGDRENDFHTFTRYLRAKFKDVLAQDSPTKRQFYGHMTSVIDAQATATTLRSVRDGILQAHLKSANFVV